MSNEKIKTLVRRVIKQKNTIEDLERDLDYTQDRVCELEALLEEQEEISVEKLIYTLNDELWDCHTTWIPFVIWQFKHKKITINLQ
mgnify:CR=1 FL=1